MAVSSNSDSAPHCHGNLCDTIGVGLRDDAIRDARASTISVVVGLTAIAGGAALWLTAPSSAKKPPQAGVLAAPVIGPDQIGLTVRGAF